jgi:hypothetical protein
MRQGTTTLDTQEYLDLLKTKEQYSLLATKMKEESLFGFKRSIYNTNIYVLSKDEVAQEMKEAFEQAHDQIIKREKSLKEKESKIEDWEKMYYNTKKQLEAIKNDDEYHTNVISFGWRSFSLGCFAGIGIAITVISLLYLILK